MFNAVMCALNTEQWQHTRGWELKEFAVVGTESWKRAIGGTDFAVVHVNRSYSTHKHIQTHYSIITIKFKGVEK